MLQRVQLALAAIAVVAAAVIVVRRYRVSPPATRRVLAPVAAIGLGAVVLVLLSANVLSPMLGMDPLLLFVVQATALSMVPVAFTLGVLRGGFAQTGEIVELGAWFGVERDRSELAGALARTLGDPTVEVVFWLDASARYVDIDGADLEPPASGSVRRDVEIELDGRRVGAIRYDPTLVADPELVRVAGRVLAIAVDRQRLTVELLASRDALRESRSRLVEEGDRARRRLARDLHDGLQARLVVLAIQAQQLSSRLPGEERKQVAELRSGLDAAIGELRAVVQDVMPALLIERGLRAATEEIVDRMPIPTHLDAADDMRPLPPTVETAAFYVVAEGLANGLKHSGANRMRVRLHVVDELLRIEVADDGVGGARAGAGSGLRGLEDRVDALGGRLSVISPPGGGTTMLALVPCA